MLKYLINLFKKAPDAIALDADLSQTLSRIADHHQVSPEELLADILQRSLRKELQANDQRMQIWRSLSASEQDMIALTCLGCTNQQIAARRNISKNTVKTHLSKIRRAFNVHSKEELRERFEDWDFTDWQEK